MPGEGSAARGSTSLKTGVNVAVELWNEIVTLARQLDVDHALVTAR